VIDYHRITSEDITRGYFPAVDLGGQRCTIYQRLFQTLDHQTNIRWHPIEDETEVNTKISGDSDVVILCSDRSQPLLHSAVNTLCLKHSQPWLSTRFSRSGGEVGPMVIPYKTACYACYEYRVKANLDDSSTATRFTHPRERVHDDASSYLISMDIMAEYTCLETIQLLTEKQLPNTVNAVLSIDFTTYRNRLHPVLRVPYCSQCGHEYRKHGVG
jgi:thiazole/oxazole-forming peptide maturase SagC family component